MNQKSGEQHRDSIQEMNQTQTTKHFPTIARFRDVKARLKFCKKFYIQMRICILAMNQIEISELIPILTKNENAMTKFKSEIISGKKRQ